MEAVRTLSLKFKKLGSDIQRAIDGKVGGYDAENNDLRQKVASICKDREIDADEVLKADTEQAIAGYSSKAMANAPRGNSAIQALQQDLNDLRVFTDEIRHNERRKQGLLRIKKNLEPDRAFDLDSFELEQFGF